METKSKRNVMSSFTRLFICCTRGEKISPQRDEGKQDFVQDRENCQTFIDMDPRPKTGFLYQFRKLQDYIRKKLHMERKIKVLKIPISLEDDTQGSNSQPCSSSQSCSPGSSHSSVSNAVPTSPREPRRRLIRAMERAGRCLPGIPEEDLDIEIIRLDD